MDTLAHGLWTYALSSVPARPARWKLLVFFGALPDLVWLPTALWGVEAENDAFMLLYRISHSLVIWFVVTLAVSAWKGRAFWMTWPWALHILIDVPGHTDILTPFLWPVSDFTIRGWWDWLSLKLIVGNYIVLALFVVAATFLRTRRRRMHRVTAGRL